MKLLNFFNLIILIISYIFFSSLAQAQTFKFLTKNIEILENGNLVKAKKGKAFSLDGDLEINADKRKTNYELNIMYLLYEMEKKGLGKKFISDVLVEINLLNQMLIKVGIQQNI